MISSRKGLALVCRSVNTLPGVSQENMPRRPGNSSNMWPEVELDRPSLCPLALRVFSIDAVIGENVEELVCCMVHARPRAVYG